MKKDLQNVLDDFVNSEETNKKENKKVIISSKNNEIIERIDKVFITESGKQLLND